MQDLIKLREIIWSFMMIEMITKFIAREQIRVTYNSVIHSGNFTEAYKENIIKRRYMRNDFIILSTCFYC